MSATQVLELAQKVGIHEAKRIVKREELRKRIRSATQVWQLQELLLELYPEIPRP